MAEKDTSMDEMIGELQALAATASDDFERRPLKDPNNKWLVRSAFQKAIRRGQTYDALKYGAYMLDTDESYAWQSLATVIIEDVGFGDLDLVAYSTVTTLKSVRDQMHSDFLFAAMVMRACMAPKSRSCCELSLGADKGEGPLWAVMKEDTDDGLHHEMLSAIPQKAYVAAAVLRKRFRGQDIAVLVPTLKLIMDNLTTVEMQRAAMLSFERTVDSMNLALFPILHWMQKEGFHASVVDESKSFHDEVKIGPGVSSAAFDMHTSQGKKAIKAWWGHLQKKYEWADLIGADECVRALGSLVFIVEGGLVDRRLMCTALADMKWYQDTNFAKGYGLPVELVDEPGVFVGVLADAAAEIPKLNELREWAWVKSQAA